MDGWVLISMLAVFGVEFIHTLLVKIPLAQAKHDRTGPRTPVEKTVTSALTAAFLTMMFAALWWGLMSLSLPWSLIVGFLGFGLALASLSHLLQLFILGVVLLNRTRSVSRDDQGRALISRDAHDCVLSEEDVPDGHVGQDERDEADPTGVRASGWRRTFLTGSATSIFVTSIANVFVDAESASLVLADVRATMSHKAVVATPALGDESICVASPLDEDLSLSLYLRYGNVLAAVSVLGPRQHVSSNLVASLAAKQLARIRA